MQTNELNFSIAKPSEEKLLAFRIVTFKEFLKNCNEPAKFWTEETKGSMVMFLDFSNWNFAYGNGIFQEFLKNVKI